MKPVNLSASLAVLLLGVLVLLLSGGLRGVGATTAAPSTSTASNSTDNGNETTIASGSTVTTAPIINSTADTNATNTTTTPHAKNTTISGTTTSDLKFLDESTAIAIGLGAGAGFFFGLFVLYCGIKAVVCGGPCGSKPQVKVCPQTVARITGGLNFVQADRLSKPNDSEPTQTSKLSSDRSFEMSDLQFN